MPLGRAELLLLPHRQLVQMRVNPLDAAVLAQQLRGAYRSHARHARHVVRCIPADRENIDDLRGRRDLPLVAYLRNAQQLVLSPALARLDLQDVRRDQLSVILVRRHHIHLETFPLETLRRRADHVVRLVARQHQHRDVQRFHDPRQRLQRLHHQRGRLPAVRLVLRIQFVPESTPRRVKTHRDVRRPLPVDQFQQILRETEENGRIHPLGIDHRPPQEGIIHLEYQRMAVYEEKFHTTKMKLFFESFKPAF